MLELPRRRFLAGLVGLVAAPAVVKATSLMPVKSFALMEMEREDVWWGDIVTTTLRYRSKSMAENISDNNALLRRLRNDPIVGGIDRSPQTWWRNPAEEEGGPKVSFHFLQA